MVNKSKAKRRTIRKKTPAKKQNKKPNMIDFDDPRRPTIKIKIKTNYPGTNPEHEYDSSSTSSSSENDDE